LILAIINYLCYYVLNLDESRPFESGFEKVLEKIPIAIIPAIAINSLVDAWFFASEMLTMLILKRYVHFQIRILPMISKYT